MVEDYTTVSSTVGFCACGGQIDFNASSIEWKQIFIIGKWSIFEKVRTKYQCTKCKRFV